MAVRIKQYLISDSMDPEPEGIKTYSDGSTRSVSYFKTLKIVRYTFVTN